MKWLWQLEAMIVAFTTPAMGHTKPMIPLLRGMVDAGLPVTCFGHRAFETTIKDAGLRFQPYPEVAYNIEAPDFNLAQMAADLINAAAVITPALKPRIAELAPRLIIQDFMALWASQIGSALNIPRIHTVPTIVFNRTAQRMMRREDGVAKFVRDIATGGPSLLNALLRSRFSTTPQEAFAVEGSWRKLQPPVSELVFCIEELQVGERYSDVPRHYIGPTIDAGRHFEPSRATGYALITFGTLSNNETGRFEAAIRGAFDAGYSVVTQCGRKVDLKYLERVGQSLETRQPERFVKVLDSVPHMEPLMAGADLVIHHAGMATTWEAVRFRKPALFIPTIADQKVLASQLEKHGFGLRLQPGREYDAEAITRGIKKLRDLACDWDRIHNLLHKAGGAPAGVKVVTDILNGAG